MIFDHDDEIAPVDDFSRAITQPCSLKELKKIDLEDLSAYDSPRSRVSKEAVFNFGNQSPEEILHGLLIDYFHKPMVGHLREGHGPKVSPYVCLLEAMHKTQRDIKQAIQNGIEVCVRVPEPVYLKSDKPVLIIDLDETLIHTTMGRAVGDQVMTIKSRTHGKVVFSVTTRPHAKEFLTALKEHYTLVLFTAAEQVYADECIKMLDPKKDIFALKLYKHNCLSIDKKFNIKDLRMFRNIPMDNILILDNNPLCYLLQPTHAIPVTSFYFDKKDLELQKLSKILTCIAPIKNKQEVLRNYFYKDLISNSLKYEDLVSTILNNSSDF